jgi:hypothetical protein
MNKGFSMTLMSSNWEALVLGDVRIVLQRHSYLGGLCDSEQTSYMIFQPGLAHFLSNPASKYSVPKRYHSQEQQTYEEGRTS